MSLEEKTEDPTDTRKREAREKGQVARSIELSGAMALISVLLTFKFVGSGMLRSLEDVYVYSLSSWPKQDLTIVLASDIGRTVLWQTMKVLLPILMVAFLTSALVLMLQVGVMFTSQPLKPQASRIDPFKGVARMFSRRAAVELVKGILKVSIVGYVVWVTYHEESGRLAGMIGSSWIQIAESVGVVAWKLLLRCAITILVIACGDFAYQKWQHSKDMKMSRQEVKEDLRRSEGDPTTRGRIRAIQRDMARKRMMNDVAQADVVVTNPIHLAVALKYDSSKMDAPIVVAKGQRLIAERIKEIAAQNRVPVMENVPLARALFKSVEIGQEVPAELFQAVAEVLAAVYRMKGKSAA